MFQLSILPWEAELNTSAPSYTYSFYKPAMFHFINISATCFGCLHKPSSGTMRTLFMRNWNTLQFLQLVYNSFSNFSLLVKMISTNYKLYINIRCEDDSFLSCNVV
jgi:hypothetical protein